MSMSTPPGGSGAGSRRGPRHDLSSTTIARAAAEDRRRLRDRSLGLFVVGLFLAPWVGRLVVQWYEFVDEERDHGCRPEFFSGESWWAFGQSTLESRRSEFLQLATPRNEPRLGSRLSELRRRRLEAGRARLLPLLGA